MVLYLQQNKMLTVELVPLIVLHPVENIKKRISKIPTQKLPSFRLYYGC